MPIFDYTCERCGNSVELIVGSSDNNHVWHPCLQEGFDEVECEFAKKIGPTQTTFKHADRRARKTSNK